MHPRIRIVVPLLLLAALIGGGYWWFQQSAQARNGALTGSGTIEAEEVLVTAEIAGRVRRLFADEGSEVRIGQELAQIDTVLLEAQLEQARATVAAAEANLAQIRAGTRSEEIAIAEAQVKQAEAAAAGAAQAYEHALDILNNPQELELQLAQARANRDAALRTLEKLRAGVRQEDIDAARASLALAQENLQAARDKLSAAKTLAEAQVEQAAAALTQAQARYAQAKRNWEYVRDTGQDALMPFLLVTTPSGIQRLPNTVSDGTRENYYAQFVQTEAALRQAETALDQALVQAEQARQAEAVGVRQAELQVSIAQTTLAKAEIGPTRQEIAAAETALSNAQRFLDAVEAMRADPQQLRAAVDAARTQQAIAESQLAQARARLEMARNGARPEQIQAAEAHLAQARAAQRQVEVMIEKATLRAPRSGIILSRPIHEGEQATPGMPLMTIGSLDTVRLTVYISESDIGRVRLGQTAEVTVDSFPDRIFRGTVTFIAQSAEFTPRNVQTRDERATTVFAVRIELPNADHALKPGMPADATIIE
ncbi:efflux RND transporter periplasmic adaptor subunit [Roseiflexus sp.]|uniref:efflux RND transporter periplasmic adaptor subunit n=1 Tax=Roseiflexus sp. TaxID=2562120 RepID=UPI00398B012E